MVNETSPLGDSPVFLGSPGYLDCFGLASVACAVAITEAMEVEQLGIDINDMARTSASEISGRHYTCTSREHRGVELAGEAEKAITAKPEALEPGAYNEAGHRHEVETPPQEGEREPEALPRERRRNLGHCGCSAEGQPHALNCRIGVLPRR